MIGVHCYNGLRIPGGDPCIPSGIAPDIPDEISRSFLHYVTDELYLSFSIVIGITRMVGVLRPRGSGPPPREFSDNLHQSPDVLLNERLVETCLLDFFLDPAL